MDEVSERVCLFTDDGKASTFDLARSFFVVAHWF